MSTDGKTGRLYAAETSVTLVSALFFLFSRFSSHFRTDSAVSIWSELNRNPSSLLSSHLGVFSLAFVRKTSSATYANYITPLLHQSLD